MLRREKILVAILVLSISLLLAFSACNSNGTSTEDGSKHVLIIVGTDEYNVETEAVYLHDLLVELDDKGTINYEYSEGSYGATIMGINSLKTDLDWNPYIAVYHNIDDVTLRADFGEFAMGQYGYKGILYFPSSVGVSQLPVYDNATYILVEIATHIDKI